MTLMTHKGLCVVKHQTNKQNKAAVYIAEFVAHMHNYLVGLSCFMFCLSIGLPPFFVCADESDIWSTCISNSCDDFVPENVVFHFCISVVTYAMILDRCITSYKKFSSATNNPASIFKTVCRCPIK